jgi:tetratricopeptide (TPR) repeat protein
LLSADAVFVGQISRYGDQVVINCQLIDTKTNSQIWGRRIKQHVNNVFELEDSLVNSLVSPLRIQLLHAGASEDLSPFASIDPEAYSEFMRGRYLSYGSTTAESERALEHFRKAIQIDPNFAEAYAAIANEKIVQAMFSTATRSEIFDEARTAVQSALAIDPNLAAAYRSDGSIKFYGDWDFNGAEKSYQKALELDPNDANNYIRYSAKLAALGKFDKAVELANKAVALDPVSISSLHNLGWVNLVAQHFEASEEAFARALELHPNWIWGHIKKSYAHMYQGECEEALKLIQKAEELIKDGWGSELIQCTIAFTNAHCGNRDKVKQVIDRFLQHVDENGYKDPYAVSCIYLQNDDFDKAFEWEERAVQERSPSAYLFNFSLFFPDDYFNDPRHQATLKEMGFR